MATDLPEPVVPAIRRWGMRSNSAICGRASDVLAENEGQGGLGPLEGLGLQQLPHVDGLPDPVRHFDTYGRSARHDRDADGDGTHVAGDVVGKADHPRRLDPRLRFELVQRDDRPRVDRDHLAVYPEIPQNRHQQGCVAIQRLSVRQVLVGLVGRQLHYPDRGRNIAFVERQAVLAHRAFLPGRLRLRLRRLRFLGRCGNGFGLGRLRESRILRTGSASRGQAERRSSLPPAPMRPGIPLHRSGLGQAWSAEIRQTEKAAGIWQAKTDVEPPYACRARAPSGGGQCRRAYAGPIVPVQADRETGQTHSQEQARGRDHPITAAEQGIGMQQHDLPERAAQPFLERPARNIRDRKCYRQARKRQYQRKNAPPHPAGPFQGKGPAAPCDGGSRRTVRP